MTTPDETWTTNVAWYLTMDNEPVTSSDAAALVAAELGGVIVPTEPEGDGMWLCTTHPDTLNTLVEVGWIGLDNGGGAYAEAAWPDVDAHAQQRQDMWDKARFLFDMPDGH